MPTNLNAGKVTTGKPKVTGAVFNAPLGTALPTDATTALNSAFICVGHITEDGVENSQELTTEAIKAWGGSIVYNPLSEFVDSFKFAMLEAMNGNAMKAYYGDDNVIIDDTTGAIEIRVGAHDMPERIWVIESVLRDGKAKRIVIPDGQVSEREAVVYKDDEPLAYGITLTAMADSEGETHYEYLEG